MVLSHFSTSYTIHGMLFLSFLASLSPLASSRPSYLFVGPVIHYSCRLGLMGFCYLFCQFFVALIIGLFCRPRLLQMDLNIQPTEHMKRSCDSYVNEKAFLPFSHLLFLLLFFRGSFFKLWTPSYTYIYSPSCREQGCLFDFPSLAVIFKTEPPLH